MRPHRPDKAMGWRASVAAAVAVAGLLAAPSGGAMASGGPPTAEPAGPTARYIVESDAAYVTRVTGATNRLGGRVVATQASLGTMVVELPATAAGALRSVEGVEGITADSEVTLQSAGSAPTGYAGAMSTVARLTGATTFWANGHTGQGVDVALLDSGVLPVAGLTSPNKLVIGPDLSFEGGVPGLAHLDTFGHGTHMAGIIAGRDDDATPATYASDPTRFTGMAPDARIVSLKLADAQGNTDVSQVVAGIDWVVAHARSDGLNIRVLNLSFAAKSKNPRSLDPLVRAAEAAWARGIVVVASSGNAGADEDVTGMASPASSPVVLAVGSVDTQGTDDDDDDRVSTYSKRGKSAVGWRSPDLVAPGTSVISLRAKGSFLDTKFAAGAIDDRFFRGSGTSQATAIVSGAAALLLSQRPELTPDQVRDILRRSARYVNESDSDSSGAGKLNLRDAYSTETRAVAPAVGSRRQITGPTVNEPSVRNQGDWRSKLKSRVRDGLRGGAWHKGPRRGTPVQDARVQDARVQDAPVQDAPMVEDPTSATTGGWTGSPLAGATWAGDHWAGATWAGATWAGATWAGATWAGATWAGATWAGDSWAGATWAGATWAGATWAGTGWE